MEIDMPTFFNKTENCPKKEIRSSFLYNEWKNCDFFKHEFIRFQ